MNPPRRFKWVKVGGLLALIPVVLACAPIAGYVAGDWLVTRCNFPRQTVIFCVIIGFVAAARETVKIIASALKAAGEGD
jgi:hypothetical protein